MTTTTFDKRLEVTIPLEFPVTVGGELYSSLTMRRPKTKDSLVAGQFKGSEAERGVFLFARLCNVGTEVIEELDQIDATAVAEQHEAFTERKPA